MRLPVLCFFNVERGYFLAFIK